MCCYARVGVQYRMRMHALAAMSQPTGAQPKDGTVRGSDKVGNVPPNQYLFLSPTRQFCEQASVTMVRAPVAAFLLLLLLLAAAAPAWAQRSKRPTLVILGDSFR